MTCLTSGYVLCHLVLTGWTILVRRNGRFWSLVGYVDKMNKCIYKATVALFFKNLGVDNIQWMFNNSLQLNDSKSEVLIVTPAGPSINNLNLPSSSLGVLASNIHKEARNLGVTFDSDLSFDAQVTKVLQSCFSQLRQLTKLKSILSRSDLEKVIHAFITSRLDYCNALYSGISKRNIQRLQLIQNAAARFLTGTKRSPSLVTCEF